MVKLSKAQSRLTVVGLLELGLGGQVGHLEGRRRGTLLQNWVRPRETSEVVVVIGGGGDDVCGREQRVIESSSFQQMQTSTLLCRKTNEEKQCSRGRGWGFNTPLSVWAALVSASHPS